MKYGWDYKWQRPLLCESLESNTNFDMDRKRNIEIIPQTK
jgi:hypothetical protein